MRVRLSLNEEGDLPATIGGYVGSGYSPQVGIEDIDGGHRVSITHEASDGIRTDTFDVMDGVRGPQGERGIQGERGPQGERGIQGERGQQGIQGETGEAGYSPTVTIDYGETEYVVTITDESGDHTYVVSTFAEEEAARESAWETLETSVSNAIGAAVVATQNANSVREDANRGLFDGYSPSASVTQTSTGATLTVTDRQGTTTAQITNGAQGSQGDDGYSPSASVTRTSTGATISITDKDGTTTANVNDGIQGADGISPSVSITDSDSSHTVTITDSTGDHSYTVPTYADEEQAREDAWDALESTVTDARDEALSAAALARNVNGNRLAKTLSGTVLTADDAYTTSPIDAVIYGASTQGGTPTPSAPVPIESVDALTLHAGDGTTDATGWPVVIDLQGHELRSLPDGTRDELTLTPEGTAYRVTLTRRTGEVTLKDEFEPSDIGAHYNTGGARRWNVGNVTSDKVKRSKPCMCSTGLLWYNSDTYSGADNRDHYFFGANSSTLYVVAMVPEVTTAAMAQWMNDNLAGATLVYPLTTEQTIDLGTVTIPALPAPNMTVWADGGSATPPLEVTYERDLGIVIANIEAAIADLATS